MKGTISKQLSKNGNNTYYYYRRTYRVKINTENEGKKGPGTGKSKVVTENIYLGTAEDIKKKFTESDKPIEARKTSFGLDTALFNIAKEINLIEIINSICPGKINDISIGEYLFIAMANRIGHHNSKATIGEWFAKMKLKELMKIDSRKLTSDAFWKAYDQVIPQKEVYKKMGAYKNKYKNKMSFEESQDFLTETAIREIELKLYETFIQRYNISADAVIYDTTNFHHYISGLNEKCIIPQTGKSKQGKNSNRLSGLLLTVEEQFGLPLFHSLYQGNRHDSKLFPSAISEVTKRLSKIMKEGKTVAIVFDKGNNSKNNMKEIRDNDLIKSVIGGFCFNSQPDLLNIKMAEFKGKYENWQYYETERTVFEEKAKVVIRYSEKERTRELKNFDKRINNIKLQIKEMMLENKTMTKNSLKKIIDNYLSKTKVKSSKADRYIGYSLYKQNDIFRIQFRFKKDVEERKKAFGKRFIFTYDLSMSADRLLELDRKRWKVEDVFRNFKGGNIVSFIPIYHWTDSKIRVQAFVNVIAYLLIKLLWMKLALSGEPLPLKTLTEALSEIEEVIFIYSPEKFESKVIYPAKLHKRLSEILDIIKWEAH